jgi:hypothetical protein
VRISRFTERTLRSNFDGRRSCHLAVFITLDPENGIFLDLGSIHEFHSDGRRRLSAFFQKFDPTVGIVRLVWTRSLRGN